MPIARAQVRIPAASSNTEDDVTNTWHFTVTDTTEGILGSINTALATFYEALDVHKSDLHTWSSTRVKWYDLDDAEPRVPVYDVGLTLTSAPSTDSAPHEVACCLSFHGAYVSGASQARRRGRIYFGPVSLATIAGATGMLSAGIVSAMSTAAGTLLTTSDSATDWAWVVYSPTSGTGYPVVGGWVDNAVDIQRRRGFDATTRTTFGD